MRTITVSGTVQGVGFRPFVFNIATILNLRGYVRNAGGTVEIVVDGPAEDLERLVARLRDELPPLAAIDQLTISDCEEQIAEPGFVILPSEARKGGELVVPADTATCSLCVAELFDPADRRHLYPFINCTACGPRFTIIEQLPYDRAVTTMRDFRMCAPCLQEYEEPRDRRFHAQPNACWDCGPGIWFAEANAQTPKSFSRQKQLDDVSTACTWLRGGKILAIKGLGGFHLACDAQSDQAVSELRKRKNREEKPFALMFATLEQLRQHAEVGDDAEKLLTGMQRPIVVVPKRKDSAAAPISSMTGGQLDWLGAMLPYTPLHHVLLSEFGAPLVMTSANLSDEPICMDNAEAVRRLQHIADAFVFHNREISTRFDDSVFRSAGKHTVPIRRSRGYAPTPVNLPISLTGTVLAVGAQLKNTFCIGRGRQGYVSQHLGDLNTPQTLEFFQETLNKFETLFVLSPEAIVHDKHPGYLSSELAAELAVKLGVPRIGVQHHHAHIVSCMAENGLTERVLGVALDGTGYGDDDSVWGGEFLIADYMEYRRAGHFAQVRMPGGEAAIRRPARMLAGYLHALPPDSPGNTLIREKLSSLLNTSELDALTQQLARNLNCPATSSCGRLFDAAAVLLGVDANPSYEGQSAAILESKAWQGCRTVPASTETFARRAANGLVEIDGPAILDRIACMTTEFTLEECAAAFHHLLSHSIADACGQIAEEYGTFRVCLSGGVFQNQLLLHLLVEALESMKLVPFIHRKLPPNDGGLAFGQMIAGSSILGLTAEMN